MKTMKSVLAVSILSIATQTQAFTYYVNGTLDGINTVGATINPGLSLHAGSTDYDAAGNQWPAFSSIWDITLFGTPGLTGRFGYFEQYSTSISAGIAGTAVVNQPGLVYSFNGGTVSYDAVTRTLTLGQPMIWSNTDVGFPTGQTSDASLKFDTNAGAIASSCTGNATVCSAHNTLFLSKPNLELFYLTLTFNSDFTGFTGSAVGADLGGSLPAGQTGNTWYHYSFHSIPDPIDQIPVPGAAWLLGSGLAGLIATARQRRRGALS